MLEEVIDHFEVGGAKAIKPIGNGHINDTYLVETSSEKYVLQRINHEVFRDVKGLMHNFQLVTDHLDTKGVLTLRTILTKEGKPFLQLDSRFWRMLDYLDGFQPIERTNDPNMIHRAGQAFGSFLMHLADLNPDGLTETITDFHSLNHHLGQLKSVAVSTKLESRPKKEIELVWKLAEELKMLEKLWQKKVIPARITHNDTKCNNVLVSEASQACVVDLDTVMPGIVHFDFGDGIRTSVTQAAEDERDLNLVEVDLLNYEAYASGYLELAGGVLTSDERMQLPISGAYMAFIMAVRFLTDHLNGDVYFKTDFPGHNLVRTKCQLKLVGALLSRRGDLKKFS